MRLIDAEELRTVKSIQSADFNSIESIQKWIDNAPTVEPFDDTELQRAVGYADGYSKGREERPQGEWKIIDDTVCECPRCKHQQTFLLSPKESNVNFCEKCGADMRGKEE